MAGSLITYFVAYAILFGFGSWYLLKVLRGGPGSAPQRFPHDMTPQRPLAAGLGTGKEENPS